MSQKTKRALIIAYYWPPSGGGGVQRWLKMVRYLPDFGITPVVVCPDNPDYPILDPTLSSDIPEGLETIRIPILEPYRVIRSLTGRKNKSIAAGFVSEGKKGNLIKILGWARGNFLIPDARKFWVRPSIKRLKRYLDQNPVDVIITTGPPHSVHLIGLGLRQMTGTPWVADMRDFWADMDHADLFRMSKRAIAAHLAMERKVISAADRVVCASPGMALHYSNVSKSTPQVVTNGYDERDFQNKPRKDNSAFIVGHYGTLGADRFTPVLWEALEELILENPEFRKRLRIELVGPTDESTLMRVKSGELSGFLTYTPYVNHQAAIERMCQASLLLLVVNENASEKGRLTGKIFEYIASETPMLGIGLPDSDPGTMLAQSGRGRMFSRSDKEGIKNHLKEVFEGAAANTAKPSFAQSFTRRKLAEKYAEIIRSLVK